MQEVHARQGLMAKMELHSPTDLLHNSYELVLKQIWHRYFCDLSVLRQSNWVTRSPKT